MPDGAAPVLDVQDLKTVFHVRGGEVHAVNDVSFSLRPGELLGVVGESGSGKSVTMMSLLGLLPSPPAEVRNGAVRFDGKDLLVFGAVSRVAPPPPGELGVVITVSGPKTPVTVRRQERVMGMWMNADEALVDAAPSFYAIATSAPIREILSSVEDLRHSVSIPRAIRSVGNRVMDSGAFTEALIRVRTEEGLYQLRDGTVDVEAQTLFRTGIELPANLIEGNYLVRIFLTRGGAVIDTLETEIGVRKVGLERWLFNLSRDMPAAYGLLSLALAILAGWSASAAFRFLRR